MRTTFNIMSCVGLLFYFAAWILFFCWMDDISDSDVFKILAFVSLGITCLCGAPRACQRCLEGPRNRDMYAPLQDVQNNNDVERPDTQINNSIKDDNPGIYGSIN